MCDCAGFSGASACDYTDWSARSKGNCALIVIKGCKDFFSANIARRTI
jgi:surfactin synthase thioesterase subunit